MTTNGLFVAMLASFVVGMRASPLTRTEIINAEVKDIDLDNDGTVTLRELRHRFDLMDLDCDEIISKEEFLEQWSGHYHEIKTRTEKFFDTLDVFSDNVINEFDLLFLFGNMNNKITKDELLAWLDEKYPPEQISDQRIKNVILPSH